MHRTSAFLAAILLTSVAIGSAGFAASVDNIRFELQRSSRSADHVQLTLRSGRNGNNSNMSSSFHSTDLAGLDMAQVRASGPVAFALIREAGRVDCSGTAQAARATGPCRFTANAAFSNLLAARRMARPTREQAFGLTMVEANRRLLDALAAARYPMPSVDNYIAMTAVGVTAPYIAELARAGYRPDNSGRLIEFAALKVTPQYLGELARAGYANLPQHEVVQLAALKIDPEFIRLRAHRLSQPARQHLGAAQSARCHARLCPVGAAPGRQPAVARQAGPDESPGLRSCRSQALIGVSSKERAGARRSSNSRR